MEHAYKVGDRVFIRALRSPGGTSMVGRHSPDWTNQPVHLVVIAQVAVCGIPDCYGVEWADTREPVGLPLFSTDFVCSAERC